MRAHWWSSASPSCNTLQNFSFLSSSWIKLGTCLVLTCQQKLSHFLSLRHRDPKLRDWNQNCIIYQLLREIQIWCGFFWLIDRDCPAFCSWIVPSCLYHFQAPFIFLSRPNLDPFAWLCHWLTSKLKKSVLKLKVDHVQIDTAKQQIRWWWPKDW